MLASLMLIPLVFALGVAAAPAARARVLALVGTLAAAAATVVAMTQFNWAYSGQMQHEASFNWIRSLGVTLSLGVDSVAMLLVALTALLGPICVLASTTAITERVKTYYAWLLVLQAAMTGVFIARDMVFFYVCFEFTLIPMYILISLYGSTNRKAAATKFFLYTFTGSIITLAGVVYVAYRHAMANSGAWSFELDVLANTAQSLTAREQSLILAALLLGFAVKVPLFPFHTWLPLAHTEAPTAGSVILAGVLLKLGTYGIYRIALAFVPAAVIDHATLIATLSIVGILYGGLICWVQTDVKKLVAYSSVAHLGFCILGLVALNSVGLRGSILYMINHGLSTGALFLLIGMVYERYHTRSMKELGGLAAKMPVWSSFMVFFAMASVGLPGLNGFLSEFMCLLGAFQASSAWSVTNLWGSGNAAVPGATPGELGPWYALIAGFGMVVAAMYLLLMVGKVVWGPLKEPGGHGHGHGHDAAGHSSHDAHAGGLPTDLNAREIGTLIPLAVLCLALGVYPKPLLDVLEAPVQKVVANVQQARESGYSGGSSRTANAAPATNEIASPTLIPASEVAR
ncbi:MAG: NADH-quinone oxidoreductase subunit M [Planctomycetota bacterium]|nr:NADH-quinone oxidoreductase subunit M [Planctomycetota bacterium]